MVQAASPRTPGLSGAIGATLEAGLERIDAARYLGRQLGTGTFFWAFLRGFHFLLNPKIRLPTKEEFAAIDRRYRALLDRDLQNVHDGWYPRELLFDVPIAHYLWLFPSG